jgi:hypothetical protein
MFEILESYYGIWDEVLIKMIEEPDIVKELREEERIGKLYDNHFDLKAKMFEKIGFKSKEIHNDYSYVKISSYKDALQLAKKVLKNLNNE